VGGYSADCYGLIAVCKFSGGVSESLISFGTPIVVVVAGLPEVDRW
jgi:hypothetical protein